MLSVGQAVMIAVAAAVAATTAVCWLGALVFFVLMLRNTSGRRTIGYMLLHGLARASCRRVPARSNRGFAAII